MKIILCFLCALNSFVSVIAQTPNQIQPYSFQFYQRLDSIVYDKDSRAHSSLKPYFIDDSLIRESAESLLTIGVDSNRTRWVGRKLFNEHLIDVRKDDFTAYADFLPDFLVGKARGKTTWLNTRGFQVGGTIGQKFTFYTSGYENQGTFADYYKAYVERIKVIPGQTGERFPRPDEEKDWSYVSAFLSYTPVKYLNITIGQDKTFIGDGYRSMLLSDFSSNYPFLRLTANLGNVQYMAMWAALQEPSAKQFSYDAGFRKKGGVFHYLDWNVNNRLSFGFFDAVVWSQYDDEEKLRGFDWGYANPFIFLRPLEGYSGSPDNASLGFTAKYELFNKSAFYGQFLLDEFEAKNFFSKSGSYRNKWGAQLGLRGADLFGLKGLNYLGEYNLAKPHTYSSRTSIISYTHYTEPLAHPYGANFKEAVGILSYSYKRFDVSSKLIISKYGLDAKATDNFGKDPFKPYPTATKQTGVFIGQGLTTDLMHSESKISYLINPKTNLRLELGAILRNEKNSAINDKESWVTFGLRSSFRNLYQDF